MPLPAECSSPAPGSAAWKARKMELAFRLIFVVGQSDQRRPTRSRRDGARPFLPPSSSYLLASYCHAPILKTLLGSCFCFRARRRFMVSCGNTPSISLSLSGMALFRYVVT